jgi:branched-chain amino acid transport system substrate-binding protein
VLLIVRHVDTGGTMHKPWSFVAIPLAVAAAFIVSCSRSGKEDSAARGPDATTNAEIKIGQTMPYSGPASAYGTIGKLQTAFFKKVNREGGINGRKVNFLSVDDAYSPAKAVEQVRKLVEEDGVLLIFQPLGTPSNTAIHKYLNGKKIPQLFTASGASVWNDPAHFPWTIGFNANYQMEARIYAKHILQTRPGAKIAVLYQNDDYGKDYLKGLKDGLGDNAKLVVAEATYEVSDATVDSQIATLKGSGADTFVNVTTPKFAAQAIRRAFDIGWKPVHYLNNVSASVGSVLTPAGLEKAEGLMTVAYYKDPTDPQWSEDAGMKEWREFMAKEYPEGNLSDGTNMYAYLAARTLVQVLEQCGREVTSENVMKQAASLKDFAPAQLLPGIKMNTGPNDYLLFEQMRLSRFDGKTWVAFGDVLTAAK